MNPTGHNEPSESSPPSRGEWQQHSEQEERLTPPLKKVRSFDTGTKPTQKFFIHIWLATTYTTYTGAEETDKFHFS